MPKIFIKEIRRKKGLTLIELSRLSGVGKSEINNIENGKVSPTINALCKIARGLNVPITELFNCEYNESDYDS